MPRSIVLHVDADQTPEETSFSVSTSMLSVIFALVVMDNVELNMWIVIMALIL
jgi:hypothetical protein